MRILVFSLPRSCSSITMRVCSSVFNLLDLKEVFSNETSDNSSTLSGIAALRKHYASRQDVFPDSRTFPEAFYTEDNYCGKILMSHCVIGRFDYQTLDYSILDRIIFTTRANIVDLMASWMLLTKFQNHTSGDESSSSVSWGFTRKLHHAYQQFQSEVDVRMLPNIQRNIDCFQEIYDFIHTRHASRCVTITYEMYQSPTAAEEIFTALRPQTSPALPIESYETFALRFASVMRAHASMHNQKCYATDVLNYEVLQD